MRTNDLFSFIYERHQIYLKREQGLYKPWTQNKILQQYRFCNVYRELDKVTTWIRENWRYPNRYDSDLWFAMLVARMFNLPTTLEVIGYPVPYFPKNIRLANKMLKKGLTVFNAAYMVRCDCQQPGKTKTDYLIEKVFAPAWKRRAELRPQAGETLAAFHERLLTCYGLGSFMAAQIVADVKFTAPLCAAPDYWTWAAPGPGSMRGLNRVLRRSPNARWRAGDWFPPLQALQIEIEMKSDMHNMPRISAQDLQNCLCEWDKYERIRLGEGRPKQRYPGV